MQPTLLEVISARKTALRGAAEGEDGFAEFVELRRAHAIESEKFVGRCGARCGDGLHGAVMEHDVSWDAEALRFDCAPLLLLIGQFFSGRRKRRGRYFGLQ